MSFILLDRDGVINFESAEYIKSPAEWHAIPGSLEAIAELNRHGFKVCIVTNQSGIARGYYSEAILQAIHEKLIIELKKVGGEIYDIFFCPHHPDEACMCRKPKPGMLYQLSAKYPIHFPDTYFIGDTLGDIEAAETVGCKPMLVHTGKGESTLQKHPELMQRIPHFSNLANAVKDIIEKQQNEK